MAVLSLWTQMGLDSSLHPAAHWHGHITSLSFNFVTSKMKEKSTNLWGLHRGPRVMTVHVELLSEWTRELTNSTVVVFYNQEQVRIELHWCMSLLLINLAKCWPQGQVFGAVVLGSPRDLLCLSWMFSPTHATASHQCDSPRDPSWTCDEAKESKLDCQGWDSGEHREDEDGEEMCCQEGPRVASGNCKG